jgi:hypothetical protein
MLENHLNPIPRSQILENLIHPDLGSYKDRKHIMNPEVKKVQKAGLRIRIGFDAGPDADPGF